MRVAILSDIHGNLVALEAVLADLAAQGGADALVIAGDLCLDGPRPREVLERVRVLDCVVVQGNTDRDLAAPPEQYDEADDLLAWTRAQIGEEGLAYLGALPFAHRIPAPMGDSVLLVVHANPKNLDQHLPPFAPERQIAPLLADLPPEVTTLAFGHLHLPYVRDLGRLRLIDIASVGLPKDGDRRAGYGLLTWVGEQWSAEQRRVEYPVEETVAQLRSAAPPGADELIRKLLRARYPNMVQARGGREMQRPSAGPRVMASAKVAASPTVSPSLAAQEPPAPPTRPAPAPRRVAVNSAAVPARERETTPAKSVRRTRKDAAGRETQRVTLTAAPVTEASVATTATNTPQQRAAVAPVAAGAEVISAAPTPNERASVSQNDEVITMRKQKRDEPAEMEQDAAVPMRSEKRGRKATKQTQLAREAALLRADEPFLLVLPLLLEGRLKALLSQVAAVRDDDDDPEAIHALRVATRHLRVALDAAEPFFGAKAYRRASKQIRTLAVGLGKVRDADVLLAYLRTKYMEGPDSERMGIETLIDALSVERAEARDEFAPFLDRWAGAAGAESAAPDIRGVLLKIKPRRRVGAEVLTGRVVAETLTMAIARFEKRSAHLADEDADPEVAHELRIAAKKLRYTLELFAPLLPAGVEQEVAHLKDLQDLLGTMHDRDVLADLLAWERTQALERQLHLLEQAIFIAGSREERLRAVRAQLEAPDSFTATTPGIYGLLIDVLTERDELEARLREHWAAPRRGELAQRLRDSVATLMPTAGVDTAIAEPSTEATHG